MHVIRDILDRLELDEVYWSLYEDENEDMVRYIEHADLGSTHVPLIYFLIVEFQYPERVL